MFSEPTPIAVVNRGSRTPEDRADAARVLRNAGCLYVRYEPRAEGGMAAVGFSSQASDTEAL